MQKPLEERCKDLLSQLGLRHGDEAVEVEVLTGGVASDIAKVKTGGKTYCVKFALPKLRVVEDWFAPVERSLSEYRWLMAVSEIVPKSSLNLFGHCPQENGFAMEFLESDDTYLLKANLLEGRGREQEAAAIGSLLGRIHAASSKTGFDRSPFQNRDDFHAIRIEPYLVHTASKHSLLESKMLDMADRLYQTDTVLIHGDVSPKNIMFKSNRPYILDAECATMGDGCFDIAFCMNHFILKSVYLPACRDKYLSLCSALWEAYAPFICWEEPDRMEGRILKLLPMLMLARVDGKSPVEYLDKSQQNHVRRISIPLIETPVASIPAFLGTLKQH